MVRDVFFKIILPRRGFYVFLQMELYAVIQGQIMITDVQNKKTMTIRKSGLAMIALLAVATTAHGQIEYKPEYNCQCEGVLYLSSFPMDTLLSDACNVVVYMLPPTFPGGQDSLNAHLRRLLPPPSSGEEGRLTVSLCINEEGRVYDVSNPNFDYLFYSWKEAIDSAMRALPRWNPARDENGHPTGTCWIGVALRYSAARGVEVTGTTGDAFPPADPGRMGYYLADPFRLPINTDLERHNLRGPVRSMEQTQHQKTEMTGETLQYRNNDSITVRHGFHFFDKHGTNTLTIMLDEKGDTLLTVRRRNWYDRVGNLLVQTIDNGQEKDTIYFRYQFTADSSIREEYEGGRPRYRQVFDRHGHLTTVYSKFEDGRYHLKQTPCLDKNGLESSMRHDALYPAECSHTKTKRNQHGDPIFLEYYDIEGHPVETRTYDKYEYDDHGNWTARMDSIRTREGDDGSTYTTRRISYY